MQILETKERTHYNKLICLSHGINWLIRGYVKTNQAPSSYLAECHLVVQWTGVAAVVEWGYQDLRLVELVEELMLRQQEILERIFLKSQSIWEYFLYRDGHGLGSMVIHLAHHCFSFNMMWI